MPIAQLSSLCVQTIMTTLKARCLLQLSLIVKPLVATLKSVNELIGQPQEKVAVSEELLQLSILKTLKALAETLPQFLLPFLPLLFSNNTLSSFMASALSEQLSWNWRLRWHQRCRFVSLSRLLTTHIIKEFELWGRELARNRLGV